MNNKIQIFQIKLLLLIVIKYKINKILINKNQIFSDNKKNFQFQNKCKNSNKKFVNKSKKIIYFNNNLMLKEINFKYKNNKKLIKNHIVIAFYYN